MVNERSRPGIYLRRGAAAVAAAMTWIGVAAQDAAVEALLGGDTAVEISTAPVQPGYIYRGERFRDPFVPLTGGAGGLIDAGPKVETGPFDPEKIDLKGILRTPTGRWAVLRTMEGASFLVQNGKIYDAKRKVVDGYQAIVKEKSLILLGPDGKEWELSLRKEEEPPPTP